MVIAPAKSNGPSSSEVMNASSEWERVHAPVTPPEKKPLVLTYAIDVPMHNGPVYANKKFEFRMVSPSELKKTSKQDSKTGYWLKPLLIK
ncbi:MAG: hypothetical protein Q7S28_04440 [bacterium]|nr:hypothetical protein [bacterium]